MNKASRIITFSLLGLLLVGDIVYANVLNKDEYITIKKNELCPEMDIPLVGKSGTYNVNQHLGKPQIINFWGISCGPCKEEMIDFSKVQEHYGDDVYVIAIADYDSYLSNTAQFIIDEGWDSYHNDFGQDDSGDTYFHMLGGKNSWPLTIIVDQEGKIAERYNKKISEKLLEDQIDSLLG